MRFSVALHNAYEGLGYPVGFIGDGGAFIRLARLAESLGFDGVWANDHLVTPRFLAEAGERPSFSEPLVTLASVAASTSRVAIGTAVVALPLREPTLLARQAATLQSVSGGRLRLGVGLGAYPEELAAIAPGRGQRRAALYDDRLATLRRLLDEPQIAPRDRIPLYIGGHGLPALERAARMGDGWIPSWQPFDVLRGRIALLRQRAAEARRDPGSIRVALELSATIAGRHEDAVRRYEESRFARHRRARDKSGRDPDLVVASNLVGSPDAIREKVLALAGMGVYECAALAFPAESESELVEQWRSFAEQVIRVR